MKTVNPKKKFGQNFLNDTSTAVQIVDFLSTEKTNNIIEVGPGMGILSKEILKIDNLNKQINSLDNKLKNKAYIKNAPKEIVQNDKKLLKELTIEDSKLRSIVSSIN